MTLFLINERKELLFRKVIVLLMKKINIGSGSSWYHENWEVLDNGPGDYNKKWQNKGKCWDTKLKC